MRKFEFKPSLRGLNLVTIKDISFKTNKIGEYIDILVECDGIEQHILNNINNDTENYVIAQLNNMGNQLRLPKMSSDELLETVKGQQVEITILDNGFRIASYTQLSEGDMDL
jgi:hypothetical protein